MATQVDTLVPGNPLTKPEERGHASGTNPADDSVEKEAKRTSGAGGDALVERGEPGQGGISAEERSSVQVSDGSSSRAAVDVGKGSDTDAPSSQRADAGAQVEKDGKCNKIDLPAAPPPKVNPWTKKMNAVTVVSVNGQPRHEPAKVVRAGTPRARRGGKVGDFADANSWPTPGEIASKDMQTPRKAVSKKEEKREDEEGEEESKENQEDSIEDGSREDRSHKLQRRRGESCLYLSHLLTCLTFTPQKEFMGAAERVVGCHII